MAQTGSLPSASIHGTWIEQVQVWDIDTDTPFDLTDVDEITVALRTMDQGHGEFTEMSLTLTNGDIEMPDTGIIQWRAEVDAMRTLDSKLYEVLLILEDDDDVVPLIIGTISIVD